MSGDQDEAASEKISINMNPGDVGVTDSEMKHETNNPLNATSEGMSHASALSEEDPSSPISSVTRGVGVMGLDDGLQQDPTTGHWIDSATGEPVSTNRYKPDYLYVMILPEEEHMDKGVVETDEAWAARKLEQKEYRIRVCNQLRQSGFFLKKQMSRDGDEYIVKISAPQALLEFIGEKMGQENDFKVKLKNSVVQERLEEAQKAELGEEELADIQGGYQNFQIEHRDKFEGHENSDTLPPHLKDDFTFRSKDACRLAKVRIETPCGPHEGGAGINIQQDVLDGKILQFFPIHQEHGLIRCKERWAKWSAIWTQFWNQEIDCVRDYFGAEIALYFCFLGHYTKYLAVPAVTSIGFTIWQLIRGSMDDSWSVVQISFGIINFMWGGLMVKTWKREQATKALYWGTMGCEDNEEMRPEYSYVEKKNHITGETIKYYDPAKRKMTYIYSFGVPVLMVLLVGCVVTAITALRHWLDQFGAGGVAGGINAVTIMVFNELYRSLAVWLTDQENHKTDTDYNDSVIFKSFMFQFMNSYAYMYIIAFIKGNELWSDIFGVCKSGSCVEELAVLLICIFLIQLTVDNFMEFCIPLITAKMRAWAEERAMKAAGMTDIKEMSEAESQSKLEKYEARNVFDDYNEMVIQLGFVWLFSPTFPLVAFLAFLNNLVEIRSDANKLCKVFQRPVPRQAEDIGTWMYVLEMMAFAGTATNIALVWWTSQFGNHYSPLTRVWGFLICEHIIMALRMFLENAIPDVPEKVQDEIDNEKYLTLKALDKLRILNSKPDTFYSTDKTENNEGADCWPGSDPLDQVLSMEPRAKEDRSPRSGPSR